MGATDRLPPISRIGDRAFIVDLPGLRAVLALHAGLSSARPAGVDDVVPAARTLAVLFDPKQIPADAVRTWLGRAVERMPPAQDSSSLASAAAAGESGVPAAVVLDVVYDGDDLDEVARLAGVAVDELVSRHASALWRVAFSGFAPGFGYLVTDDDWFEVPRRTAPRTRVPAGAVGLAGRFSGAYPREGPGGWQLIGRTDAPLWRATEPHPALLTPGTVVRFRPVEALDAAGRDGAGLTGSTGRASSTGRTGGAGRADRTGSSASTGRTDGTVPSTVGRDSDTIGRKSNDRPDENQFSDAADPAIPGGSDADIQAGSDSVTVLRSGPQLLVEDLGRPASASIGAGRSGALDRGALRLANRLVGNLEHAAGLEVLIGAELRFDRPTWFAVTGAGGALRVNGHPIEPDAAVLAHAEDVLELGPALHGLRYYVALRGGVSAQHELDSASTDVGARVGAAPLADGQAIALAAEVAGAIPAVDALTVPSPPDDEVDVHVVAGPREDWFAQASVDAFYEIEWEVTQESNRVGARLRSPEGVVLKRSHDPRLPAELPSEPMVPGAIQVPPSGEPMVLLADGPVTGGYPVIAVVADADLDLFAQLRPGQRIRFRHALR
ncbi:5-oxoprolinase/urea amidolyase family protein [Rathayibacter sp. KR2-224]|uniref:5-oxoprolinase subunit B/C family protein n=1 Tax=Rathayibacter sp. KR2-224 TaxID=3400913 RepID=UPI003C06B0F7